MTRFIEGKRAVIVSVFFGILFIILRVVQLETAVEFPSGFYAQGSEAFNTVFNILLVIAALAITAASIFDVRKKYIAVSAMSKKSASAVGIVMILAGAAMSVTVIAGFSAGIDVSALFTATCCAAYIAGGMTAFIKGRIVPAHCISAIFIIICYLIKAIKYYLDNPIIVGMSNKLLMMAIYVLTVLFWINQGRIMSGGAKKLTGIAASASGLFCGVVSCAYVLGGIVFAAINGVAMSGPAEIAELIISGFTPAAIAVISLFSYKSKTADKAADEEITEEESADTDNEDINI